MEKPLSELTLNELWTLFPIILKEHNPQYSQWYKQEKAALAECIGSESIWRISHIGSTAVAGLIAKPTIDILLEIHGSCDIKKLTDNLICAGWLLMASEYKPDLKLVFNKGYTPKGFADKVYHLHVRHLGDWNELYFRDYLIAHPDAAQKYSALKLSLCKAFEHDRDGYTAAKTQFVTRYTEKAKMEFCGRYLPKKGLI